MLGKRASEAVRLVVQLVLEGWKGRLECQEQKRRKG